MALMIVVLCWLGVFDDVFSLYMIPRAKRENMTTWGQAPKRSPIHEYPTI